MSDFFFFFFFEKLIEDVKTYWNFMPGNAMAHTANNTMNALAEVFGERVVSQRPWPACSPSHRFKPL
jgi:hypothetical protein